MSVLFKSDLWSSDYVQRKQLSIKIQNFTAANLTERQRNMKWTFSLIINNKVNYWIKQVHCKRDCSQQIKRNGMKIIICRTWLSSGSCVSWFGVFLSLVGLLPGCNQKDIFVKVSKIVKNYWKVKIYTCVYTQGNKFFSFFNPQDSIF